MWKCVIPWTIVWLQVIRLPPIDGSTIFQNGDSKIGSTLFEALTENYDSSRDQALPSPSDANSKARAKRDSYNEIVQPNLLRKVMFQKIKKMAKIIDKKSSHFFKKFSTGGYATDNENYFKGDPYPWAEKPALYGSPQLHLPSQEIHVTTYSESPTKHSSHSHGSPINYGPSHIQEHGHSSPGYVKSEHTQIHGHPTSGHVKIEHSQSHGHHTSGHIKIEHAQNHGGHPSTSYGANNHKVITKITGSSSADTHYSPGIATNAVVTKPVKQKVSIKTIISPVKPNVSTKTIVNTVNPVEPKVSIKTILSPKKTVVTPVKPVEPKVSIKTIVTPVLTSAAKDSHLGDQSPSQTSVNTTHIKSPATQSSTSSQKTTKSVRTVIKSGPTRTTISKVQPIITSSSDAVPDGTNSTEVTNRMPGYLNSSQTINTFFKHMGRRPLTTLLQAKTDHGKVLLPENLDLLWASHDENETMTEESKMIMSNLNALMEDSYDIGKGEGLEETHAIGNEEETYDNEEMNNFEQGYEDYASENVESLNQGLDFESNVDDQQSEYVWLPAPTHPPGHAAPTHPPNHAAPIHSWQVASGHPQGHVQSQGYGHGQDNFGHGNQITSLEFVSKPSIQGEGHASFSAMQAEYMTPVYAPEDLSASQPFGEAAPGELEDSIEYSDDAMDGHVAPSSFDSYVWLPSPTHPPGHAAPTHPPNHAAPIHYWQVAQSHPQVYGQGDLLSSSASPLHVSMADLNIDQMLSGQSTLADLSENIAPVHAEDLADMAAVNAPGVMAPTPPFEHAVLGTGQDHEDASQYSDEDITDPVALSSFDSYVRLPSPTHPPGHAAPTHPPGHAALSHPAGHTAPTHPPNHAAPSQTQSSSTFIGPGSLTHSTGFGYSRPQQDFYPPSFEVYDVSGENYLNEDSLSHKSYKDDGVISGGSDSKFSEGPRYFGKTEVMHPKFRVDQNQILESRSYFGKTEVMHPKFRVDQDPILESGSYFGKTKVMHPKFRVDQDPILESGSYFGKTEVMHPKFRVDQDPTLEIGTYFGKTEVMHPKFRVNEDYILESSKADPLIILDQQARVDKQLVDLMKQGNDLLFDRLHKGIFPPHDPVDKEYLRKTEDLMKSIISKAYEDNQLAEPDYEDYEQDDEAVYDEEAYDEEEEEEDDDDKSYDDNDEGNEKHDDKGEEEVENELKMPKLFSSRQPAHAHPVTGPSVPFPVAPQKTKKMKIPKLFFSKPASHTSRYVEEVPVSSKHQNAQLEFSNFPVHEADENNKDNVPHQYESYQVAGHDEDSEDEEDDFELSEEDILNLAYTDLEDGDDYDDDEEEDNEEEYHKEGNEGVAHASQSGTAKKPAGVLAYLVTPKDHTEEPYLVPATSVGHDSVPAASLGQNYH